VIATIKTNRAGMVTAWMESIKYGLEFEPHADNTFDLTVHRDDQLDKIVSACAGSIIAKQQYTHGGEAL